MKQIVIILCSFLLTGWLDGQNLASLPKQSPLEFSGGLRLSSQFYNVTGIDPRRSPFAWQISGNPSLSFYGIRMPLSFSFNGRSASFRTPSFNRFGASPYYKWIKLHVGHRNMRFSNYTFSGKTFLGAGIELTPGKFRFSMMIGRLRNLAAVRDTSVYLTNLVPDYRRKAYAFKVGYGTTKNYFDLILFRSIDDLEEYPQSIDAAALQPLENLVVGTESKVTIAKRITLDVNGAVSALSDDIRSDPLVIDHSAVRGAEAFFQPRKSSVISYAGDVALNVRLKMMTFGTKYQRIEPFFQSFGTNFYNNDKENLTLNGSFSLLQRKIRINSSFGVEKNNLRKIRAVQSSRTIGSIMINVIPSKAFNFNLRYANYQRENRTGLLELNDTLRFVNISQQSGGNFSYRIEDKFRKYTIGLSANYQHIEDQSAVARLASDVTSYNFSLRIGAEFKELAMRLTPTLNYSRYNLQEVKQERYGFGLRVSKSFHDKKSSINLSSTYNWNDYNELRNGRVFITRLNYSTKVFNSHKLGANVSFVDRTSILRPSFKEIRSRLSYGYTF